MAKRKIQFVNDDYYHVFNRGVDKRDIFTDKEELYFFFNRLHDLNSTDQSTKLKDVRKRNRNEPTFGEGDRLVKVVAYCLLPNHFHLLLKQTKDDGISKYMQRLGTSYVKFFNKKHERSGALFQGKFKATHLSGDFGLSTLSSYVNLNYKHHKIDAKTRMVKSSVFEYLGTELGNCLCDNNEIKNVLEEVGGLDNYKKLSKNASIAFAYNKNITLSEKDFEY